MAALKIAAPKILVIPGSLRSGSHNVKLAMAAAYEFAQAGVDVTRLSLDDYPLPIYDGDLQAKSGVPRNAVNLKRMMGAHHGVLIVTPEYNSSVPPLVKNTIDWVTRVQDPHEARGEVFRDRAFAIAAASESRLGRGSRGPGPPRSPRRGVSRPGVRDRRCFRKPPRRNPGAGGVAADPV